MPRSPKTPHSMKHDPTTPIDPLGIRLWPAALQLSHSNITTNSQQTIPQSTYSMIFPATYFPEHAAWDSSCYQLNNEYRIPPNERDVTEELHRFDSVNNSLATQKLPNRQFDFTNLSTGLAAFGDPMVSKEMEATIHNPQSLLTSLGDPLSIEHSHRRFSASSFISSSPAAVNDVPEMSAQSEALSYYSDYTPRSTLNPCATPLSQTHSPRYHVHENGRAGNRPRASPSPRPSMRAAPYSYEGARSKSWSTGSHGPFPARRSTPIIYNPPEDYFSQISGPPQINSPITSLNNGFHSTSSHENYGNLNYICGTPHFHRQTPLLPSTMEAPRRLARSPQPLPQSPFPALESNVGPNLHEVDHYIGFSDPPDLFGPLYKEQLVPPEEDLQPLDMCLAPFEQQLRFDDDLYTPRYVRGQGNKREGWCGICKPGRWLVLKNSAYWYDKSFTHGVSAASGQAFEPPQERRPIEGNPDLWEGLCGKCGEWIALVSSKKKGTTWFRHAYKCHTHQKVKDAPNKRRESKSRPGTNKLTARPEPKLRPVTPSTPIILSTREEAPAGDSPEGLMTCVSSEAQVTQL